jgi:hypothetical protein
METKDLLAPGNLLIAGRADGSIALIRIPASTPQ